jgi:hypothetical protein
MQKKAGKKLTFPREFKLPAVADGLLVRCGKRVDSCADEEIPRDAI